MMNQTREGMRTFWRERRHNTLWLGRLVALCTIFSIWSGSASGQFNPSLPPVPDQIPNPAKNLEVPTFPTPAGLPQPAIPQVAQNQPPNIQPPNIQPPDAGKIPVAPQPVQAQPGQPGGGAIPIPVLPQPNPLDPFGPNRPRLPRLPKMPGLGSTPTPTPAQLEKFRKYIKEVVDPENTLDLIEGRARLLILKQVPIKIQIVDESIANANVLEPKELTVLGLKVGTTVLNLWFADPKDKTKRTILSYLVRVIPDPEAKERIERVYQALAVEINRVFPNSYVELELVGDKLVIRGQAHDIAEATQILRIVRANAPNEQHPATIPINNLNLEIRPGDPTAPAGTPGLDSFLLAGGPNVINLLRIPGEQQVMLKVTVAEVNRAAARSIGLNFTINNDDGVSVFSNTTGLIASGGSPFGIGGFGGGGGGGGGSMFNNLPVALDNGQITLAISALRNINYARSLAEPNLTTLNGQTATFLAGGQFPVPVVTSGFGGGFGGGLQGVSFVPFGVQLAFTPYITDRSRIRLALSATVSTRNVQTGANIGGAQVSGLNSRTFQTTVELRDGETLAVAGLIQNNLGADATRVPFIGDIPILNNLTGFSRTSAGEQELVVLVTPVLVHPMNHKEVPPLPGSDVFEPGDLEFYLLGRLESRRSYDYRSPVMTDCQRMRSYHNCERIYIFGPHGHQPNADH